MATSKQLSSKHVRRLRTMRQKVLDMATQWEDQDQFLVNRLVELADQIEAAASDLLGDDATEKKAL